MKVIIEILVTGTLYDPCSILILFTIIVIVFFFTPQCEVLRIHGSLVTYLRAARCILSCPLLTSDVVQHLSKHLIDLCSLALDLLLPMCVLLQLVDFN